jgi:NADH-quinone oxidoreductase subunit L
MIIKFIALTPFLGFLINGVGFKHLSKNVASIVGCGASIISFILVVMLFQRFDGTPIFHKEFDWFSVGDFSVAMQYQIDQLSLMMLLVVTGVGSLIHIYSVGYMHHDEGYGKFMSFLNLFLFFMIVLVMGSNYLVMFVGWEGVGLASYLLIGFWNKNVAYGKAARKAFVMNRIGDLGFLLGIFMIISYFGSVEYQEVFAKAGSVHQTTITIITLLLFVGAMGKSAQVPLYTWLPDAMAGPTPVSALIHAATMVTAGIYMVIRSNVLFSAAPETLHFIGWIGLATALLAASIGLFQNDIKKVLAYSTVSQLGYMFMALGVGAYTSSYFHVMTHAFFKALLFLGAGSVIHAMSNEQDIRNMGGLRKALPITFWTFLIATIAISGIPPFAGFFSKDEILAHVYEHSKVMWFLALLGSAMTSFYMFRLLFLTFFGEFRGTFDQKHHLHESPLVMTVPLMILAVLSAIGGFFNLPEIFGGHAQLGNFLKPLIPSMTEGTHALDHSTETMLMGISIAVAVLSLVAAYVMFVSKKTLPAAEGTEQGIQKVIYNKYYVDELYDKIFVKPVMSLSKIFYDFVDYLVIDGLVVMGLGKLVKGMGSEARQLQTGTTGTYIFGMVIGILAILAFVVYRLREVIFV